MQKRECVERVCVNRQNRQHGHKGYSGVTPFVIDNMKTDAGVFLP